MLDAGVVDPPCREAAHEGLGLLVSSGCAVGGRGGDWGVGSEGAVDGVGVRLWSGEVARDVFWIFDVRRL